MAKNCSALVAASKEGSLASVMGASHVISVTKHLQNKYGFVDRAADIIKQAETSKKNYSFELGDTVERDLLNPFNSFLRHFDPRSFPDEE